MIENKKAIKGYTLVELLAVIVIIGILMTIGIVSVSKLIGKAKDEKLIQQEKTLKMAAESYFQDNRSYLPREVGKTATVSLSDLKAAKYITEDVKNANGESCMGSSMVEVKKESTTKYTYKTIFHCGE